MSGFGPLEDNEPLDIAGRQFMAKHFPTCENFDLGYAEVGRGAGEHYELDICFEEGIIDKLCLYQVDERPTPRPHGALWSNGTTPLRTKSLILRNGWAFVPQDETVET